MLQRTGLTNDLGRAGLMGLVKQNPGWGVEIGELRGPMKTCFRVGVGMGREREESEADSTLSAEPNTGLDLTNLGS